MRTSLNPLMYKEFSYSKLFESAGTYELLLSPGTYYVAMCGGGGAGGNKGANSNDGQPGGNGGAGGNADIIRQTIDIIQSTTATVYVGTGGLTKANGGNGGNGGSKYNNPGGAGGGGGGGGQPTYITFGIPIDNNGIATSVLVALGGGGGGGGGGGNNGARYAGGAGGGGGGGSYIVNNTQMESRPGKNGASGGKYYSAGVNGTNGYDGNVTAGNGGTTMYANGGTGGTGYGASGGSGAGGEDNGDSGWKRPGGGGGGGAGGSATAGGGAGGIANGNNYNAPGTNGSNYFVTPAASTNYLGKSSTLGMGGQGQTSTQSATNGYNGWFYIAKFQPATPLDMGNIDESVTRTVDCLGITGSVESTLDMGNIA